MARAAPRGEAAAEREGGALDSSGALRTRAPRRLQGGGEASSAQARSLAARPRVLWERAAPRGALRGGGRSLPRGGRARPQRSLPRFLPLCHSAERGFCDLIFKQTFLFWRFGWGQPPR